jgi:hypothetical protein
MSSIEKLNTVLNDFQKRMDEMKKSMVKEFEGQIKDVFKEVFEAHPDIEKIAWTQYTPYFNDGDPCVFRVYDIYFLLFSDDEETRYSDLYEWHSSYGDGYPVIKQLEKMLSSSEDILLMLFGDHCQITVTRDGLDVDEFDHD